MIHLPRVRPLLIFALACLGLCACFTDGVARWDSFDYEAFLDDFESPTGNFDGDRLSELSTRAENMREFVQAFATIADTIREAKPEAGYSEPVAGTNLFVNIACPGPDLLDRDTTFGHGRLRIESPGLLLDAAIKWEMKEDILMSAQNCQVGPYMITGESVGYIDQDTNQIALDVGFNVVRIDAQTPLELDIPVLFSGAAIQVLVRLSELSYTLSFDPDGGVSVAIGGLEETYSCDLSAFPPPCQVQ